MADSIEFIDHQAIVKKVDSDKNQIFVRIDDSDECGECPAANLCASNGKSSNLIIISTPKAYKYNENDIIMVRGTEKMHRKAIMYATVFPCIILIAGMIGIFLLTGNQLAAALSGIGLLIVFYFILWLCRNKIAHEFVFTVVGTIERADEEK